MAMTTTDPPVPPHGDDAADLPAGGEPIDRVAPLRGAGVDVDGRRVARVAIVMVLVVLAVLTVVFTVAGVHTNQQDDRLHDDGVPVTFTVTGCLGLLGGSGSNAAGYSCHGTYVLDGKRYFVPLPGDSFHRPGSTVPAVAVPGDEYLVSPVAIVATEHSSAGVFVLPAILGAAFVVLVALLWFVHRRRPAAPTTPSSGAP